MGQQNATWCSAAASCVERTSCVSAIFRPVFRHELAYTRYSELYFPYSSQWHALAPAHSGASPQTSHSLSTRPDLRTPPQAPRPRESSLARCAQRRLRCWQAPGAWRGSFSVLLTISHTRACLASAPLSPLRGASLRSLPKVATSTQHRVVAAACPC